MNYDVIIVGASFTGAYSAWLLAREGHKVLLLDAQARTAIGAHHPVTMVDTDIFSRTSIPRAEGDELLAYIDVYYAYSPSAKVKKPVNYTSLQLHGHLFLQRLLGYAEEAGATFQQEVVRGPVIEGHVIKGVVTTSGTVFSAPLVIDASGMAQVVRKHLPEGVFPPEPPLTDDECGLAWRLVCDTGTPSSEVHLYFAVEGGYVWRSPYDIGLGMMCRIAPEEARSLVMGHAERYGWDIRNEGAESVGKLPMRPPLTNMVAPGLIAIGDAAYMLNTVRGGGVSSGLKGARVAAEVAHQALREKDLSLERLWEVNYRYHREIGAEVAYQNAMRLAVMNLDNDNMEFALATDLMGSEDIRISLGGKILDLNAVEKLKKGLKALSRPSLLMHFDSKLSWSKKIYQHVAQFPELPQAYPDWRAEWQHIQDKLGQ